MLVLELIGNLGNDAVAKTINDKSYISFDVAHSNGKDKPSTWVQVLVSEYLGKRIMGYLKKGASVFIRGNLSVSTYESKKGEMKVSLSVFANELQLVRTVEGNLIAGAKSIAQSSRPESGAMPPHQTTPLVPQGSLEPNDEDLPF